MKLRDLLNNIYSLENSAKKKLNNLIFNRNIFVGAKIHVVEGSIEPRRAHMDDAGLDIALQHDFTLPPYSSTYIPAGVELDLPRGISAQVMTRSGTPRKHLTVVPTLIDSNYKDEISTVLSNFTSEPVKVSKGDYLAQVILMPAFKFDNEHEQFKQTNAQRGRWKRFGSTEDDTDA